MKESDRSSLERFLDLKRQIWKQVSCVIDERVESRMMSVVLLLSLSRLAVLQIFFS